MWSEFGCSYFLGKFQPQPCSYFALIFRHFPAAFFLMFVLIK